MKIIVVASSLLLLGMSQVFAEKAQAVLQGTKPDVPVAGLVQLEDSDKGLKINVQISKAPAGEHAFHIHEFGSCANEAKDAGSHYNPTGNPHGQTLKDGVEKAHAGDFGNIKIDSKGQGQLQAVVPGLSLTQGKRPVAGRAFVLHEKTDDFSQPSGNAGGRIGCGPIVLVQ